MRTQNKAYVERKGRDAHRVHILCFLYVANDKKKYKVDEALL